MKFTLQIFTGSRHTSLSRAEDIIGRIGAIASRIDVNQVIIGWCSDVSVYRDVGSFLHGQGIRMLLWLPVFSEISEQLHPDPALDLSGQPAGVPDGQEDGAFRFVCPASPRNIQIVKDTYERTFACCGFDGVFLDRIRGQSFAAGVSGVLSCACDRCRKAFLQKGVDIDEVRKLYAGHGDAFFDVVSWPMNGEFVLEKPLAQRFFEIREEIIAGAVTGITRYFKDKGLIVGLDLFAPVVSRWVGQHYPLITEQADFIKPMLYRRTDAPAGIGYECALAAKHTPNARGLIRPDLDPAFLRTQLQALSCVPCAKYPGIEINYDAELVRTDPGYIRESLSAVKDHGFGGAVLCWNIMEAPQEHIDAVIGF